MSEKKEEVTFLMSFTCEKNARIRFSGKCMKCLDSDDKVHFYTGGATTVITPFSDDVPSDIIFPIPTTENANRIFSYNELV